MVHTDLSGNTYNSDVITTSVTPTNESRYGHVNGIENGKYMVQCGDFNYIICGLTIDEITEYSRVDYNKRQLVLEFDTQVTETVMFSELDDSWSSSTAESLYPVAGGNVRDFLNALNEGIDIKYIVHNYHGGDEVFYGNEEGGVPENMDPSAFGLSCQYGVRAFMYKETGTDKLYLQISCELG